MSLTDEDGKMSKGVGGTKGALSSKIFSRGVLVNISIGVWGGVTKQSAKDEEITGSNRNPKVYGRGHKFLVDQKCIAPFLAYRTRLNHYTDAISYKIPGMMGGARFVPRTAYANLLKFLNRQKSLFDEQAAQFIQKYPELKERQILTFNEAYPESAGWLDDFYPKPEDLRSKFYYSWTPYCWTFSGAFEEVQKEMTKKLEDRALALMRHAVVDIRESIVEATQNMTKALGASKNTVNSRTVAAFKKRLEQMKDLNMFKDQWVDEIIDSTIKKVDSISDWSVEEVRKGDLAEVLKRMTSEVSAEAQNMANDPDYLIVDRRLMELGVL